ncbi:CDN_1a_G0012600.mRNA.1.CDS.1 [Saccharomyces cerevisiae]|nr:Hkr1p [Saccharomyces cerevisiae YJM1338]CAI4368988.1 ABH_G0012510.mRNA.1.CDS.1 [Saccharomyces cerevisiae]CAI4374405.1 CDN_1a_G0012600.mRNA.1.CDS.1 [Saccharomyces cerevisiae]CAI6583538.1 ABH_G0012510.mRNA.1.CDS.1 [Saccharomyces cerevisiae]CAI7223596.1 CDN_1a_G0012600.mRNA.1.CDS.1 [Saccharomyces cerevisiae]
MVSLKIKKILLLVSLLNAIEAYSNDTIYSTSYNNGIESTPSYSTSAISSTGSSNKENAITSSSETTTMAGQYGESGSTTIIDEQETGTSSQYISVTTTTQTSDTMSSVKKSTEIATPSSSIVPTPLQSYSDASQISQTLSHNPKSVAESDSDTTSSESSSSVIISTSDSSAVPREISPIITTDSQISKEEGTLAQTSSISETTRIAQMVTRVSQISSITAASTIDGFSSESTQTDFSSTVSFENSVEEEYAMSKSQLSESYSSSSTVYSGGESTADKTSSSPITSFSSSYSQTTSTETSESSRVAVGVSRPSSITQTTSIDSFSMSEVELSTYYDLSAGNYPDQELIVDRPATSSTAKTSSEASQGVSRESNTFAVSSISTTNFIVSSASDTVVSTSSTNTVPYSSVHSTFVHATSSSTYISSSLYSSPSLSASVSSQFGIAPFPSAYISFSSVPAAVSSTYTSSPSAPAAVSSTYTSSPSAPAAVSSTYTSSPSAPAAISSTYTSSPSAPVAVSSTYTSSPSASVVVPSAYASSPSVPVAVSSTYTSSPSAPAVISSTHTSSPSAPVAVSSTYTSSPSAPAAVSSTYTSSPSAPAAVSSTYTSSPSAPAAVSSTYTSSPSAPAAVSSTYTSSPSAPAAVSSTYTSSPSAPAAISSTYTSSPSAPVAVSSTYTSSPSAPIAVSSTYTSPPPALVVLSSTSTSSPHGVTSSPSTFAAISSGYTPSPSASVAMSSTSSSSPYDIVYSLSSSASRSSIATYEFSPSPSTSLPTSSTYTYFSSAYAFEFSSERYSTTSTIAPTQIHSTLSRITDLLLQTSMAIQSIVSQQISTSSTLNDEIHSSALSVFNPSASNLVETSLIISSTQASITSPKNSAKISSLQSQLSSSTKNPYDTANKNTETSGRSTVVSNFLYTSSAAKPDNEKFSATPTEITTISSSSHAYSLSTPSSHNSVTGLSHNLVDSSKSATSFDYSSSSISSIKLSKETMPASKSVSNTQERITSFTSTLRANSQSEKSEGRNSVGSLQSSHISSNPSLSTNTKVDSKTLSRKVSKTMGENGEETGLTTTKTQYKSSSETSGSYSRSFTRISIGPATTAVQTQASTNSVFTAPALSTYPTTPYPSPNSYAWLPTAIIVESSETGPTTASFNPSITGSLPNAIEPAVAVSEPINHTLITIGFTAALNYVFLVQNPLSSAQIFNFLPLVLKYPFSNTSSELDNNIGELSTFILSYRSGSSTTTLSPKSISSLSVVKKKKNQQKKNATKSTEDLHPPQVDTSSIAVKKIVPMVDSSKAYIISVAEVYFPTEAVTYLQQLILDENSTLYSNPQTPLRSLAGLIDSGIPLGGLTLYGSGDGGYVPSLTSSSVLDSSKGNSQNIDGTYKYGALDDFINSFTDSASAGKYAVKIIIFLIVLTIGVLLWLFVAFFAFRHRNILLKRHPRNCIEKSLNNERELESTELSRSSSGNQVYNEKPPESENESVYSAVDDHYIVTGENTVYNTIHRLHYTINDDGDLLYRDAIPLDFDQTNGDDGSGIDSIVRDCVYDKNQDATEAFLNDEESISGILDVDENGDIRLYDSYSDNEESNSFHLPDEVIENYNKNHLCETKLHGLGTESCTTDDPDTGNQITNEFSTGSQTCLPSTAYTTPLHTNSIKLHTLRYTESSLPKPNQTLFSNLEDLEIEDIDDNGSVSDVHIEELDALDEELYKRMSKVIKQQNHQTTKT